MFGPAAPRGVVQRLNTVSDAQRSRHEAEQAPRGSGRDFWGLKLHPESLCEDGGAAGGRTGWGWTDGRTDVQSPPRSSCSPEITRVLSVLC